MCVWDSLWRALSCSSSLPHGGALHPKNSLTLWLSKQDKLDFKVKAVMWLGVSRPRTWHQSWGDLYVVAVTSPSVSCLTLCRINSWSHRKVHTAVFKLLPPAVHGRGHDHMIDSWRQALKSNFIYIAQKHNSRLKALYVVRSTLQ